MTSTIIVHPQTGHDKSALRDLPAMIGEIQGLARAIDLEILETINMRVPRITPATFIGKGQCETIAARIENLQPGVVIVNHALSPVQQRNLEKAWNTKVIDRTGLILEIFGARAQTKEGTLQVELAALEYQRSRLVRSWTHLERQRATGKTGGPGETQIELDRRLIDERITKLRRELENVRRTRDLGRQSRARIPLPVVSLVGYTNAGKSTLFNTLTGAKVMAEDLLFATLDPTMRRLDLPDGQKVILSDTVGFISDLPTHLIAAFRATLEQAVYSDMIVHVIDVSRPEWQAQREDVIKILGDLGITYEQDERIFELYNKLDLLNEDEREDIARRVKFTPNTGMISALDGQGKDIFLQNVAKTLARGRAETVLNLPVADGKALSWLYERAQILSREDGETDITLHVMIEPADLSRFTRRFGYKPRKAKNTGKRKHGGG